MRDEGVDPLGRRVTAVLQREGPGRLSVKVLKKMLDLIFLTNVSDWYCADLTRGMENIAIPPEVEIAFDSAERVIDWMREIQVDFPWIWIDAELRTAGEYEHFFPLLHRDEELLGFMKVGLRRAYVTDYHRCIDIPPNSAFIYDTFVHPDHRGHGLASCMVAETMKELSSRSISRLWCHIPEWNRASIRTYAKCGFKKVARIRYARLLGFKLYMRNPERLLRYVAGYGQQD